jgi:hypothetical protein
MPRTRQDWPPETLPRYGYGSQHSLMVMNRERDSYYRIEAAHRDFEASEAERVDRLCEQMNARTRGV